MAGANGPNEFACYMYHLTAAAESPAPHCGHIMDGDPLGTGNPCN